MDDRRSCWYAGVLVLPSEEKLDVGEDMTACEGKVVTVPEPEPEDKASLFAAQVTVFAVCLDQGLDGGNWKRDC